MSSKRYVIFSGGNRIPEIILVDAPAEGEGVPWREAKKQLRQWFLDQAAALRNVTEETYLRD